MREIKRYKVPVMGTRCTPVGNVVNNYVISLYVEIL